jgi:mono/diheme cytochrome c family protein
MSRALTIVTFLLLGLCLLIGLSATASSASATQAPASPGLQATPEPGMMFEPTDRLAPPLMSDPPTPVEQGHYVYYLSCMVCHGDRGQGLTEEWRGALDPADQNCWQSKCHAPNHPPQGFELPRFAPPLIGPGQLAHHETAAGLYSFIRSRMPWQAPGLLSDEEYWQLTAFLVNANGISWGDSSLGPQNAAFVRLDDAPESGVSASPGRRWPASWPLLLAAGLLLLTGVLTWRRRNYTKENNEDAL